MEAIPHIQQSTALRNCGAACLAMIYQKHRKRGKLRDITASVSVVMPDGYPSCRNNLMIQNASSNGFIAAFISYNSLPELLKLCCDNCIDLILSFHPKDDLPTGHFCVVCGYDNDNVYLNDPDKPRDKGGLCSPCEYQWIESHSKAILNDGVHEIVVDNTAMVLMDSRISSDVEYFECPKCRNSNVFPAILKGHFSAMVCPQDPCWFRV